MCIRDRPESEPQSGKEARPSGSVPHDSLWLHIPSVSLSRTTPAKRRQLPSCRRTAGTPTKASDLLVLNREQRPEPSSPQNRSQPPWWPGRRALHVATPGSAPPPPRKSYHPPQTRGHKGGKIERRPLSPQQLPPPRALPHRRAGRRECSMTPFCRAIPPTRNASSFPSSCAPAPGACPAERSADVTVESIMMSALREQSISVTKRLPEDRGDADVLPQNAPPNRPKVMDICPKPARMAIIRPLSGRSWISWYRVMEPTIRPTLAAAPNVRKATATQKLPLSPTATMQAAMASTDQYT